MAARAYARKSQNHRCDRRRLRTKYHGAGWSSPVARQAHNLKVTGSNPVPATNITAKSSHQAKSLVGSFASPIQMRGRISRRPQRQSQPPQAQAITAANFIAGGPFALTVRAFRKGAIAQQASSPPSRPLGQASPGARALIARACTLSRSRSASAAFTIRCRATRLWPVKRSAMISTVKWLSPEPSWPA